MASGTEAIAFQGNLENGFCREHGRVPNSENKIHEDCDDSAQAKAARPPLMRHCSSQVTLADPFSLVRSSFFPEGFFMCAHLCLRSLEIRENKLTWVVLLHCFFI